jgi:hypothetical protein|tara:strand:+ start:1307 stop:1519 length:213 start_codon:yes stop_codon:yes gene_type:complete
MTKVNKPEIDLSWFDVKKHVPYVQHLHNQEVNQKLDMIMQALDIQFKPIAKKLVNNQKELIKSEEIEEIV